VLFLVLGALLLVLLAATVARYSMSWEPLAGSDRLEALIFFVVIGLPVIIVGLALIARYVDKSHRASVSISQIAISQTATITTMTAASVA
jgi:uncharacterized membrane protein